MRSQYGSSFSRWTWVVLTALLLLVTAGVWFYHTQQAAMRQVVVRDLSAVAQLKVDQLTSWRKERLGNTGLIMNSRPMLRALADFHSDRTVTAASLFFHVF